MDLGLADYGFHSANEEECEASIMKVTGSYGCERTIDCSANSSARALAIRCTRKWGKMVMVGEGSNVTFNPSPDIMHGQKNHLWFLGHVAMADGGTCRAPGTRGHPSRPANHISLSIERGR